MVVYVTTTTVLASVVGAPFQAALAIGFCAGLAVHFTLQRRFVWRHRGEFALPLRHQAGRYLAVSATQYGLTAASTSLLAPALGLPTEVVYLGTVAAIVCTNFLVFRHVIFHAARTLPEPTKEGARGGRGQGAKAARRQGRRTTDGRRGPAARRGVRHWAPRLQRPVLIDLAIATVAVLLIASPLLFTDSGFAPDFTNALWLAGYQQHTIAAQLHPSLFLQSQIGIFYPFFAFYGGTLFALTGALGVVLGGSTVLAFEVATVAAIAAAYGGVFWIARQLGVRGIMAHAPAVVYVTSAYYVTNLYGRGAWAEFVATSVFPLVIASALRVVRGRPRIAPAACLVAATAVFGGSHNITLLWGTTLAVLALVLYWILSGAPRGLPWRRISSAAGLIALGMCLNAWFLLPDVFYSHETFISHRVIPWSATGFFNTAGVIFDPLRDVPSASTTPALYVQLPVLALIWGLIAVPLAWRQKRLRPGVVTAVAMLVGVLVVIMSSGVYSELPSLLREVQFAYRLQIYATLASAGLVLIGALTLTRRAQNARATGSDRALAVGLGLVVAFGVALSAWQLWVPNTQISESYFHSLTYRSEALEGSPAALPESWNAPADYVDIDLPVASAKYTVQINPEALAYKEKISGQASLAENARTFATDILGSTHFVDVGGDVRVRGRSKTGGLVLERTNSGSHVPIKLSPAVSGPVLLGRIVSLAAAGLLLALLAIAGARGWRKRRSAAEA